MYTCFLTNDDMFSIEMSSFDQSAEINQISSETLLSNLVAKYVSHCSVAENGPIHYGRLQP